MSKKVKHNFNYNFNTEKETERVTIEAEKIKKSPLKKKKEREIERQRKTTMTSERANHQDRDGPPLEVVYLEEITEHLQIHMQEHSYLIYALSAQLGDPQPLFQVSFGFSKFTFQKVLQALSLC